MNQTIQAGGGGGVMVWAIKAHVKLLNTNRTLFESHSQTK